MKKIIINKKAILFSLISVLFAILFITIFSQSFSTTLEDKIPGSNIRIKVMDTYTKNFESYIAGSIKVSTYRILESITMNNQNNGFFSNFQDFNQTFNDCMVCGKFSCADSNDPIFQCPSGDSGYDLTSRLKNIKDLSLTQLNIKTDYAINSVDIRQDYPFQVEVYVNVSYNVTDNSGGYYAKWTRQSVIHQSVSIIGLTDPLGFINSKGNYDKTIQQYAGSCQFNESCWNFATTKAFYLSQQFRYYPNGTSFLERYWNDTTPSSCCGLEHIMNGTGMTGADLHNSFIDHYYWSDVYKCTGSPTDIKILNITFDGAGASMDEITASRYGVSGSGTTICP